MHLETTLITLRGTFPEHGYIAIAEAAKKLAVGECVAKIKQLVPALKTINVVGEFYNEGHRAGVQVDHFSLLLWSGQEIDLEHDLDAQEDVEELREAMQNAPARLKSGLPESESDPVRRVFDLLNELRRVAGIIVGDNYFNVAVPVLNPEPESLLAQYPNLTRRNTWVYYSFSEDDGSGNGYWSNEAGWSTLEVATHMLGHERYTFRPPMSSDGKWCSVMRALLPSDITDAMDRFVTVNYDSSRTYVGVEIDGIEIAEKNICLINNSDPMFYTVYLRDSEGMAHAVADFWDYQTAFREGYGLSRALNVPITRATGDQDAGFLTALNRALKSRAAA